MAEETAPRTIALLSSQFETDYLLPAFREEFPLARILLGGASRREEDLGDLAAIDAVVCWMPQPGWLARMPQLKLVQSVGAGVDHITADPALPAVPVCRIIDPHMASGMAAYVCWAVTHHHRAMGPYLQSQRQGLWQEQPIVPASQHRVGIAGLGTLGLRCAQALAAIGYPVSGWSRTLKNDVPEGVRSYHGAAQLDGFLAQCDTLICLLPLTAQTQGFLNAELFARMPEGAHLINVGRGEHLVEPDLIAALDNGHLAAATLDAFAVEPLPSVHPFWRHPRITVTPHIATRTSPAVIARQTRQNFAAIAQGISAPGAVNLARGY